MTDKKAPCKYVSPDGHRCGEETAKDGLCFWHCPNTDKSNHDLKTRLEDHARSGGLMQGLQLKGANLKGVDLVNRGHQKGFDLSYSDLYRADLSEAHLFNLTLKHGSLMKADVSDANLHCCDFSGTNLLGIKWRGARIDGMDIGKRLMQEDLAHKAGRWQKHKTARDNFEQSEEIYRDLRKAAEQQGLFEMGGRFIQKELTMRRFQYPPLSARRLTSKFIDLFCGYGERPLNVIIFSLILIFVCAIAYFLLGTTSGGEEMGFSTSQSWATNIGHFLNSLYYSVVTFTTLGYGDITPVGASRFVAAIEAFTGSFTLALFVVVFVKKMTR
ncbi:ion channel [Kordiimonas lacus]|uniref:Ion channel n=1 Tax=Kordiimonas lacus TaxID=637679 RepID=A0A1G6UEU8_9PROT|nr:ion channel [Kordiimonas lacus]SDD39823.1 Ion channel [Kordiimonas lacus]